MPKLHPKRRFLHEVGALHPHPERVLAQPFLRHRFFDPLDKIQVKYEMLRSHEVDRESVVAVAAAFGFSRETYYTTLAAFRERGVPGLSDGKAGRPGPLKLTEEVAQWLLDLHAREPKLSGRVREARRAERGVVDRSPACTPS